jgi:dipeptidyl aminopeptidase/acylaminoacyl peptidase
VTAEIPTDIRGTALYRQIAAMCERLRQPGSGQVSDATEPHVSPDGRYVVFAGTLMDSLSGQAPTRICRLDLYSAEMRVLTFGPKTDRLPKYSPDGRWVAFLSDRDQQGDFQLHLLDLSSGAVRRAPSAEGWVEYLHWSPDGQRILLGVAGHGADVAGAQGAIRSARVRESAPAWMPIVHTANDNACWRRAWVYELRTNCMRRVSGDDQNVWEANWCGNSAIVAIVSPGAAEGLWYSARLVRIDCETSSSRELYAPAEQLGWVSASSSGRHIAVVEALCSDRGIVAGDLRLIDASSGVVRHVDTRGIDISCTEWRSERNLLLAGHRGFESVVALYDVDANVLTEVWSDDELTTAGRYLSVTGLNSTGDCVLVSEGYTRAPQIAVIRAGEHRAVKSLDLGYADEAKCIGAVERLCWLAPDGREIQGWLLQPESSGPRPLVLDIHGGPVWHWRPRWLGRTATGLHALTLLKHDYAVFFPNPRGSGGRGQAFARLVTGDLGGADMHDHLSGLDYLVARGTADPQRLGVTGGSYGGYMSSWLITQDSRFAAAVPVAPVTNRVSQYLLGNLPQFATLFLADRYDNPNGKFFQRNPIMYAHKVRTPTLTIAGALDRCTPAEEALQFHNALLQHGAESALVVYPQEGHGVRQYPAIIDYAARVAGWFIRHMPARHGTHA